MSFEKSLTETTISQIVTFEERMDGHCEDMLSRLKTANDKRRNRGSRMVYVGSAKIGFDGYFMYNEKIKTLKELLRIHGYSIEKINDMIQLETKRRIVKSVKNPGLLKGE